MQPGTLHVWLEEGTQSGWLSEILSPHAARVVVTHVKESRGQKNDEHDAFGLADQLRTGAIQTTVYKSVGAFQLAGRGLGGGLGPANAAGRSTFALGHRRDRKSTANPITYAPRWRDRAA